MAESDQPAGVAVDRGVRALDPERIAFDAWLSSLKPEDRYDFDGEGRGYRKDPLHMMWLAWQAARPKRDKVGAIYNVASALAQRKPLEALAPLTEVTHIGHRQMARAYSKADEDTRLLAVKLADAVRAL